MVQRGIVWLEPWRCTPFRQWIFAALAVGCGIHDYELGMRATSGDGAGASNTTGTGAAGAVGTAGAGTAGAAHGDGPIGWASSSECGSLGTTGGAGGPTIRPATAEELDDAARAAGPAVIEISGRMELGDIVLQMSGDKTVIGVNGAEVVGSVRVLDARNVILRNVKFNGGGAPSSKDALEVDNSACVWIDHCEVFDGGDSNLDIVRGSDLVTVSWSKFHYVTKTDDHRLGSVCGNSNADWPGRINVTFHHNWWGDGLLREMPGVRHGMVHIFNNYFSAANNDHVIAARYMAKLLVQNNVFDGVNNPIIFDSDEETAEVLEIGNDYTHSTGEHASRGVAFTPPYAYTLEPPEATQESVTAGAGVR